MTENQPVPIERQVAGSIKEAIGKVTGDAQAASEGAAQKQRPKPARTGDAPHD